MVPPCTLVAAMLERENNHRIPRHALVLCNYTAGIRLKLAAQLAVTEAAKENAIRVDNRNKQQAVTSLK